jgi:hypothetical protein
MIGFLAEDATLSVQQHHDIASIQVCAFNMQRLVNDVLDLAKLREGKLALQPVMVREYGSCEITLCPPPTSSFVLGDAVFQGKQRLLLGSRCLP